MENGNQRPFTLTDVAHVSRNTPCGDWLRHYWIAIWRSEDLKDIPQAITVLGEDLVLFRDEQGRLGLLAAHCCHRGTSLEYGDIEDGGIRCPYHGWLYDIEGNCLEQPGEPKGSIFFQKVKQPSYPVRELGGLIFAYMGKSPEPPPLPKYSSLVRDDGIRSLYPCRNYEYNWFNFFENAPDLIHAYILHKASRTKRSWERAYWEYARTNGAPNLEAIETVYGMKAILHWQGPSPDTEYVQQTGIVLQRCRHIRDQTVGAKNAGAGEQGDILAGELRRSQSEHILARIKKTVGAKLMVGCRQKLAKLFSKGRIESLSDIVVAPGLAR